uniref:PGG domain-containing protein n=1 Tax=Oryza glumipatula TaxID=40148 RepID=A0A0E0BHC7_9ORYZ
MRDMSEESYVIMSQPEESDTDDTSSSGYAVHTINRRLMEAAKTGDSRAMRDMTALDPDVLLQTTKYGSNCLHISTIHGHLGFCKDVVALNRSVLAAVNSYGETPLLTAVTTGRTALASELLRLCSEFGLSEVILKQDDGGCNALHHAIRGAYKDLAMELIDAEPTLSQAVNKNNESPMFIAVMRDFADIFEKLLVIPDSSDAGCRRHNALHGAVRNGNSAIARRIMEKRPWLAKQRSEDGQTPMHQAVLCNKVCVLRVLLEHDCSLGYVTTNNGTPLLISAAFRGHIGIVQEILSYCPDAPYSTNEDGWTCLHQAVNAGHTEFVKFILSTPQLRKLTSIRDSNGKTALHYAVMKCNPKMVAALLSHRGIDVTMLDNSSGPPNSQLRVVSDDAKTLNWNEVSMLLLEADPQDASSMHNLYMEVKDKVTKEARLNAMSLTQTYTTNTSLVAILIATITFAAAFTLPGGYKTDAGSEGLPVMAKKFAFQVFLVSDTLAMCSSFSVAFICIIAKWEDLQFLIHYRTITY